MLRGVEVDILRGGGLDLPDDVLAELDWVQLSLHAGQREPRRELTEKVTDAMRHPAVRCLSHPKGRILNHRPPNALDLERVFEVALEHGVALEVNGLPDRLDLAGPDVRLAVEAGVPIVVSTDAHSVAGLGHMRLAVATAQARLGDGGGRAEHAPAGGRAQSAAMSASSSSRVGPTRGGAALSPASSSARATRLSSFASASGGSSALTRRATARNSAGSRIAAG